MTLHLSPEALRESRVAAAERDLSWQVFAERVLGQAGKISKGLALLRGIDLDQGSEVTPEAQAHIQAVIDEVCHDLAKLFEQLVPRDIDAALASADVEIGRPVAEDDDAA